MQSLQVVQYSLTLEGVREELAAYDTDNISDRDELLNIICDSVNAQSIKGKAQPMLSALIGTVLLGEWEIDDNPNSVMSYNCASIMKAEGNLIDAQEVLRKDVVRAFWTNSNGVFLTKEVL